MTHALAAALFISGSAFAAAGKTVVMLPSLPTIAVPLPAPAFPAPQAGRPALDHLSIKDDLSAVVSNPDASAETVASAASGSMDRKLGVKTIAAAGTVEPDAGQPDGESASGMETAIDALLRHQRLSIPQRESISRLVAPAVAGRDVMLLAQMSLISLHDPMTSAVFERAIQGLERTYVLYRDEADKFQTSLDAQFALRTIARHRRLPLKNRRWIADVLKSSFIRYPL